MYVLLLGIAFLAIPFLAPSPCRIFANGILGAGVLKVALATSRVLASLAGGCSHGISFFAGDHSRKHVAVLGCEADVAFFRLQHLALWLFAKPGQSAVGHLVLLLL